MSNTCNFLIIYLDDDGMRWENANGMNESKLGKTLITHSNKYFFYP